MAKALAEKMVEPSARQRGCGWRPDYSAKILVMPNIIFRKKFSKEHPFINILLV
jgi:hypothetical protein